MTFRKIILGALAAAFLSPAMPAAAQQFVLTLHQALPANANMPRRVIDVWANAIEAASEGRIRIKRFGSMQLGGTAADLYDHAAYGVADIAWAIPGFTPGRFPSTEVFELPFFVEDTRAASAAFWDLHQEAMTDETAQTVVLAAWVHGPGLFHTTDPVETPEDLQGMKIRGGSRLVTRMLDLIGAEAIGMPAPQIAPALSKGVLDGAALPWEVTPALGIADLLDNHTEFEGRSLYTLTFLLVMNRARYESLPADLRAIIDAHSGRALSVFAGGTMADGDAPARELAVARGNEIVVVPEAETDKWRALIDPIYGEWAEGMAREGKDGRALIDRARALMEAYDPSDDRGQWP